MLKNIFKIILSIILITSWWWSFKIVDSFPDKEIQILTTFPFFIFSIIAAIGGTILFIKTTVNIFNIKDRNL